MKANGAAGPATARLEASRAAIGQRLGNHADGSTGAAAGVAPRPPQPARLAWGLASHAAQATLAPVAERHPWALVGGAAVAGGLLVAVRPWRLVRSSPLLLTLATQLAWRALAAGAAPTLTPRPAPAASSAGKRDDDQGLG